MGVLLQIYEKLTTDGLHITLDDKVNARPRLVRISHKALETEVEVKGLQGGFYPNTI